MIYYRIKSKLNGFVIDIDGLQSAEGTPLIAQPQKRCDPDSQLWMVVSGSNNEIRLQSKQNGAYLVMFGRGIVLDASNADTWRLDAGADGYFVIKNNASSETMSVPSSSPGTQLTSASKNTGDAAQLWHLERDTSTSSS